MNIFADKEKKQVACRRRQEHSPPAAVFQAFGNNRKQRDATERSGGETDQRTQRFVR